MSGFAELGDWSGPHCCKCWFFYVHQNDPTHPRACAGESNVCIKYYPPLKESEQQKNLKVLEDDIAEALDES